MLGFGRRKKKKQDDKSTAVADAPDSGAESNGSADQNVEADEVGSNAPSTTSSDASAKAAGQEADQIAASTSAAAPPNSPSEADEPIGVAVDEPDSSGFFSRMRKGLGKTRAGFTEGLGNLLLGEKVIDDEILEEIEMQLIMADVGVDATRSIVANLTEKIGRRELLNSKALYKALQRELQKLLIPREGPLEIDGSVKPYVILVVGVNGVGKTTTIGKIARHLKREGKSVMLAAGDTYRAAAVEQLQVWGERNDVTVVAQHTGADSASVIYDALQAAQAREADVLIADTAGRLHTKSNLMEELKKVKRVLSKLDPQAPHETLLVLDSGTGQNALSQAEQFHASVGLTGLALTKLDGTAKGGVIFAIAEKMELPIRYIGVGEQLEDLRPFEAKPFVEALFGDT
ncbi:MAG: signal recognition particle-docking protein FtsY [Moraxellaceae bacterium]|nr:MAG: signal recognition particle-docking protein FtsY [Moraxellaceae bacterium]